MQHRRYFPVPHAFRYAICLLYLDLDEIETVFSGRFLWSLRRPAVARFRRADYLGDPQQPLAEAVRDVVEARLLRRPMGAIRLLTQPRYFGLVFNPISVYYCFDSAERLDAVVLEVCNTPWGERCTYVIDGQHTAPTGDEIVAEAAKVMHVSPFMEMALQYRFTLNMPSDTLDLNIDCMNRDRLQLDATLSLQRRTITRGSLRRVLWRYPWMTGKVLAAIYYQALRLWWKRIPFVPHPRRQAAEGSTE